VIISNFNRASKVSNPVLTAGNWRRAEVPKSHSAAISVLLSLFPRQ
jgi:hypothetical protein